MANKRLKKKQTKKMLQEHLLQNGYNDSKKLNRMTKTELQATVKKVDRNIRQKQRRADNLAKWDTLGIDKKIISQFDLRNKNPDNISSDLLKTIKTASRTEKARQTREHNKAIRYNRLIKHGYLPEEIKPSWINSDVYMYEALGKIRPNKVYTANVHLAIAFTDVDGSPIFNTSKYRIDTFEEILQKIEKRVYEAAAKPGDSGLTALVFEIRNGSEDETEHFLNVYEERGYNFKLGKLTDRRYYRLVNRNDWTMREFAELTLCVLMQINNRDVPSLLDNLEEFVINSGLPFWEVLTDSTGRKYTDLFEKH